MDKEAKGKFATICIEGVIESADVEKFSRVAAFAAGYSEVTTVDLNSNGGSVAAAVAIGKIVRANWFWTSVDDQGQRCQSACVLILAAGANRMAGDGSHVGIHRPFYEPQLFSGLTRQAAQAKYAELSAAVRSYLASMGMPDQLYSAMMAVPSGSMRSLTYDEMVAFSLIGKDPAYDEWLAARRANHPQGSSIRPEQH